MSIVTNIHIEPTLLGALEKNYSAGSYVRTLGFKAPGDGGAAMYRVTRTISSGITDKAITYDNYTLYCLDGQFHIGFDSDNTIRPVFEIIPSNGRVFAEQFGVLPETQVQPSSNTASMNNAVSFSSSKGYKLKFASKKTYYFKHYNHPVDDDKDEQSIVIKSNLFIDGNGATLRVHDEASNNCNLFNMTDDTDLQKNVNVRNLNVVGRTREHYNPGDQAFHVCLDGFILQNVTIKNFSFGIHTYGRNATKGDYTVPEVPNKNWLIENCSITDTIMGLELSEIDGITVKDTVIQSIYPSEFFPSEKNENCYYDPSVYKEAYIYDYLGGDHNIYMSSNCINVRLSNLVMGNVTGDAVHKAYAVGDDAKADDRYICFDKSKNHFYTDLSIHKCNAPLNIGFISENVMCDNVYGTYLRYLVHLSAASNCIVSNSSLTVDRPEFDRNGTMVNPNLGLYVHSACSCWFQNSYLYTNGRQRSCEADTEDAYYHKMSIKPADSTDKSFVDKRHMRTFVGEAFDVPNHWFKFTGCELKAIKQDEYYFPEAYDVSKTVFHEYWDNCNLVFSAQKDFFRLKCINTIPAGITIRNSYLKNICSDIPTSPIRFQCGQANCNCSTEDTCSKRQLGKRFPFVHYENNILNKFLYANASTDWNYHINTYYGTDHNFTISEAVDISGSYVSNVYRLNNGIFTKMSNLM